MNKTIIFLICLIVPFVYTQHDILNLIDNTPEGKELLNHLFIQTQLTGSELDSNIVSQFLKSNRDKVIQEGRASEDRSAGELAQCAKDKEYAKNIINDHTEKQIAVERDADAAQRKTERSQSLLNQAKNEIGNYEKFRTFIAANKEAWNNYFNQAKANYKAVRSIFQSILDSVNEIPRSESSFIELPNSYHSSLAQIRITIESNDVDFKAMTPIVSNLMEIMQNPVLIKKPPVAVAIKGLVNSLIENNDERFEILEEENEHQTTLFDHLEKTFTENTKRSQEAADQLSEVFDVNQTKAKVLAEASSHATALTEKVKNIMDLRKEECNRLKDEGKDIVLKHEKIMAIINQVEELLITKTSGIQSFFIQTRTRGKKTF